MSAKVIAGVRTVAISVFDFAGVVVGSFVVSWIVVVSGAVDAVVVSTWVDATGQKRGCVNKVK